MLNIILDTNIWISFVAQDLSGKVYEKLMQKTEEGEIILLANEVIIDEWRRNKAETISKLVKIIKDTFSASSSLHSMLPLDEQEAFNETFKKFSGDEDKLINLAEKKVQETEALLFSCQLMPVTDEMRAQVIDWALNKKAPFHKNKNSVGDALIALSSTEFCKQSAVGVTGAILVTYNSEDFSQPGKKDEVHDDLKSYFTSSDMIFGGGLIAGAPSIMRVNDELNADVVHGERTAEGAGLAHEYATALTQGAVDGFNDASLPTAFGAGLVGACGQHALVGLPLVGVVPGAGAVGFG